MWWWKATWSGGAAPSPVVTDCDGGRETGDLMTGDTAASGGWHPVDPGARATFDIVRDVAVPMSDGTILSADLYLPAVARPVPAILDRTGYGRAVSPAHWTKSAEYFAAHGFAVVIQDVRGIHGSAGRYYPWKDDGWGVFKDGFDTVEWVAAQTWCDGNVGMYGGSYSGATQLRAAAAAPPHLRALVSRQAPVTPLVSVRPDGVLMLTEGGRWFAEQARQALLSLARDLETELSRDTEDFYRGFFTQEWPDQLAWVRDFLAHDHDDEFWRSFDVVEVADRIEVPILHLGSWYDLHRRSTMAMFDACRKRSPAAASQRLLMGPWLHGTRWHTDEHGRYVGEVDMGPQARLDLNALSLRWFERWLIDEPQREGASESTADASSAADEVHRRPQRIAGLAPVTYFVMGRREWREADRWPPAGSTPRSWFTYGDELLDGPATDVVIRTFIDHSADPARTIGGDAVLSESQSQAGEGGDHAGAQSDMRTRQRGPRDQRAQEHKGVTFTTALLEDPVVFTGRVTVTASVQVESSMGVVSEDAFLLARLSEIVPDGRSLDLVDGACRIEPDAEGKAEVTIDLGDTAVEVPAGHRLRLTILASNFPRAQRRRDGSDLTISVHTGAGSRTALTGQVS